MGFHVCEYCTQVSFSGRAKQPALSSGDVSLFFADRGMGHQWVMPDMIVHYVRDHGYLPPQEFIDDMMLGQHIIGERWQTKGISSLTPTRQVGYLSGDFPHGVPPTGFLEKLQSLMQKEQDGGDRRQTRGMSFNPFGEKKTP